MKKVLIIESNEILDIIEFVLKEEGYETVGINHPVSLTQVTVINPDLVIVHERISKSLSGREFISNLKSTPALSKIPTILSSTSPDLKTLAHNVGADAYLSKPFDLVTLSRLVNDLIKRIPE